MTRKVTSTSNVTVKKRFMSGARRSLEREKYTWCRQAGRVPDVHRWIYSCTGRAPSGEDPIWCRYTCGTRSWTGRGSAPSTSSATQLATSDHHGYGDHMAWPYGVAVVWYLIANRQKSSNLWQLNNKHAQKTLQLTHNNETSTLQWFCVIYVWVVADLTSFSDRYLICVVPLIHYILSTQY